MMTENVDKQLPGCVEPRMNSGKQQRVVSHMLHHLYRNHTIKPLIRLKVIDVTGDDLQI